jgi:class 3 adenylate cyclase
VIVGFAVGVAYRALFDDPAQATLANFMRSACHGAGVGLTAWLVQIGFVSTARSPYGARLRRAPLVAEVVVRSLVMTVALLVVGLTLQAALYAEPLRLRWLTRDWLTIELPRIVLIGFGLSLLVGALAEMRRLVGGPMLLSALLGTYHRPSRQQRIVMFLDMAHSTRLAESMGELRVHDLITRFFFDLDQPVSDLGGVVHAYVGDEVIVTWPVAADPELNARCVRCFFAIDDAIARRAKLYEAEFGLVPEFRAGMHAGPLIVSECGDEKRQLALFGDTMNVGARLCDYCKAVEARLVVSEALVRMMTAPSGVTFGGAASIEVRGREARIEAHVVERRANSGRQ